MATSNGSGGRTFPSGVAIGLGIFGAAAICAQVILSITGHQIPSSLDGVIWTIGGALGGAFAFRPNGAGNGGTGVGVDARNTATPGGVKAS